MSNPRHFKLKVSTFDGTLFRLFFNSFVVPNNFKKEEQLEVIEYSAYEQLEKENSQLRQTLEEHKKFFLEVCKTENGEKIVGISKAGAVRFHSRTLYVCRNFLWSKPYTNPIDRGSNNE